MRRLADGIYTWSVFSEEKQLDFNGYFVQTGGSAFLIDPPSLSDTDAAEIESLARPSMILLTNKDHRRAAPEIRSRYYSQVLIHEADLPLLDCHADNTFHHGDLILGGLEAIHLPDMKSPGECALYSPRHKAVVLGDSLIGKPAGSLSLLPEAKVPDPAKARESLHRLLDHEIDMVLVGDGESILESGGEALRRFLGA